MPIGQVTLDDQPSNMCFNLEDVPFHGIQNNNQL